MLAHEMTFGVEIECFLPSGAIDRVGGYHSPCPVAWLPAGWGASSDGSLHTTSAQAGMQGVEFVSPVLRGQDGVDQVMQVLEAIKARGGDVNATCGLHVHVGFNKSNYTVLAHLLHIVANHEKGIYAITGTKNRERGSYCKSVKQYGSESRARRNAEYDRYHVLNLRPRHTVEFRAFAGTLNKHKVAGTIGLCLGLVEYAFDRANGNSFARWTQATSANPANVGQKELERLLGALGWKGRAPVARGFIRGLDNPADRARFLRLAVKVMREMAKKYDEQA